MRCERTTANVVRFASWQARTNNYAGSAVRTNRVALQRNGTMLVLSRKKNESIVINNDITIVVVEIRGDKVRLGVEAPKEVPVHRREVYEAIKRNESAQREVAKTAGEPSSEL
jgi:carbon storage regulator